MTTTGRPFHEKFGLPPIINVGDEELMMTDYHVLATAGKDDIPKLLGLGDGEVVQDNCVIMAKNGEDEDSHDLIAVGSFTVAPKICGGHYPSIPILPLHWGLNSLSQTGVLLIKFLRRSEEMLPQVVSLDNAKGHAFTHPDQTLIHCVVIDRERREYFKIIGTSWHKDNMVMQCTFGCIPDITIAERPISTSWDDILKTKEVTG